MLYVMASLYTYLASASTHLYLSPTEQSCLSELQLLTVQIQNFNNCTNQMTVGWRASALFFIQ